MIDYPVAAFPVTGPRMCVVSFAQSDSTHLDTLVGSLHLSFIRLYLWERAVWRAWMTAWPPKGITFIACLVQTVISLRKGIVMSAS